MGKEQIRVLWSSGTWKRMCIWAEQDHDSLGRAVDWLSLDLWKRATVVPFLRFPRPSPSPMPNGIWTHVTRRKRDPSMAPLACEAVAAYEKAHGCITLSVLQRTPSPNRLLLTGPLSALQRAACQKTDPSHQGPEWSSCSACIKTEPCKSSDRKKAKEKESPKKWNFCGRCPLWIEKVVSHFSIASLSVYWKGGVNG